MSARSLKNRRRNKRMRVVLKRLSADMKAAREFEIKLRKLRLGISW